MRELSDQEILSVFSKFTIFLDTPWQKVQLARELLAASAAPAGSVVVPMKLVQLLEVVRKDGVLKRSSELQEAFRLLDGSTIKGDGHA